MKPDRFLMMFLRQNSSVCKKLTVFIIFLSWQRGLEYAECILCSGLWPSWNVGCPEYDTKYHVDLRSVWYPKITLLSGPLWQEVVVPVTVPVMSEIEIFDNY